MKKAILATLSAVALFGVAACSDTDETTTQSTNPPLEETAPAPLEPAPAPEVAPTDEAAPADPTLKPAPMEPAPAQ